MDDATAWKSMYLIMSRATERAINGIIDAQVLCEEIFMATGGSADKDGDKVLTDAKLRMVEARDALQKARMAVKLAKDADFKEYIKY